MVKRFGLALLQRGVAVMLRSPIPDFRQRVEQVFPLQ